MLISPPISLQMTLPARTAMAAAIFPPPPPKTGANSTAPPSGLPGRPHRSSDQGGTGVVTTDQGSNTADNSVSSFDGTGEGQGAGEQNSNASNTADRGRPPRTNADHPQGYSDNYVPRITVVNWALQPKAVSSWPQRNALGRTWMKRSKRCCLSPQSA